MTKIDTAREWIATDAAAIRDDIRRLGIQEAAQHNAELVAEVVSRGDTRWQEVTAEALREAMADLGTPVRVTPQPEGAGCDCTQYYLDAASVAYELDSSGVPWVTGDLDAARDAVRLAGHGETDLDAELEEPTLEVA